MRAKFGRSRRPFTWLDGLILAAFAGLGVASAVKGDEQFLSSLMFFASRKPSWEGLPDRLIELELPAKRVQCDFISFLIPMSLGVAIVILRGRPWRGLPSPGIAAAGAAAAVIVFGIIMTVFWSFYYGQLSELLPILPAYWNGGLGSLEVEAKVTGGILGVWSYLLLARAWQPRADWRDWIGRWLGWAWLSNVGLHFLFPMIWG